MRTFWAAVLVAIFVVSPAAALSAPLPWATSSDLEQAAVGVGLISCRALGPVMSLRASAGERNYQYYQAGADFFLAEMSDPTTPRYAWVGRVGPDDALVVEREFEYSVERDGGSPCPFLRKETSRLGAAYNTVSDDPTAPPFPWGKFAAGIMKEPGAKISSKLGACPAPLGEHEVSVWVVTRASGELWVVYAALPSPGPLVGVRFASDTAGFPSHVYFGDHDGDAISIKRSEPYDRARHGGSVCGRLFAEPA